jgi:hypothetical protein
MWPRLENHNNTLLPKSSDMRINKYPIKKLTINNGKIGKILFNKL